MSIESKGVLEPLLVQPTAGRPLPDHRGGAPLPRRPRGRPGRGAVHRARRSRQRGDGDRADREPASARPASLRGSDGLRLARRDARLHAAADRGDDRKVARLDHRGDVAPSDSGAAAREMSARRHRCALGASRDRAPRRRATKWKRRSRKSRAARRATICASRRRSSGEGKSKAKPFHFVYKPKDGPFKINISFQKSRVQKEELIDALRQVLRQLESGELALEHK